MTIRNVQRWTDLQTDLATITGLNIYNYPVDGDHAKTPFVLVKLVELANISNTGQGCSVFDGIRVNLRVGVSTKRDFKTVQDDSVRSLIELFHQVQNVVGLGNCEDARFYGSVTEDDVETYILDYSGDYTK